ncbi:hypothetical protein SLEP1_g47567 [Rubroshorea leprosula]|uniref:Uncharacterized protein n=1 Tax=Rubroshorea leprosula TaxID=152421 RepID=A0AAV5LQX6_9ROSI|nr:hypothetical protein SLEP1_g47567 [Rubroshorea leprosula]
MQGRGLSSTGRESPCSWVPEAIFHEEERRNLKFCLRLTKYLTCIMNGGASLDIQSGKDAK